MYNDFSGNAVYEVDLSTGSTETLSTCITTCDVRALIADPSDGSFLAVVMRPRYVKRDPSVVYTFSIDRVVAGGQDPTPLATLMTTKEGQPGDVLGAFIGNMVMEPVSRTIFTWAYDKQFMYNLPANNMTSSEVNGYWYPFATAIKEN